LSKLAFRVRRVHKWLAMVIGVQALLWMFSGVYMSAVSLSLIHGDHLVQTSPQLLQSDRPHLALTQLLKQYPNLRSWRLKSLLGQDMFEIRQGEQTLLIDAGSGALLSPLPSATISALARSIYRGTAPISTVTWITQAPKEVARQALPLWAVHFDDAADSILYFSPDSGELVARRHQLWRWFDFLWMLHIMDYDQRIDANNLLLRISASLALLFSLSGAGLLVYSLRGKAGS